MSARVESVEYEGKVFLVHLVTPSGARFIAAHSGEGAPEEATEVIAGWSAGATHLFAKSDGAAVDFAL